MGETVPGTGALHRRASARLACALAALVAAACPETTARVDASGSRDGGPEDGEAGPEAGLDGDLAPDGDGGDQDGETGPPPPCVGQEAACTAVACHAPPLAPTCLGGLVLDEGGAPLSGQPAVVCAAGRCHSGRTDGAGWFAIPLPSPSVERVAVAFPGTRPLGEPFCPVAALCDGPVATCEPFRLLPAPTSGTPVPAGPLAAELRLEADDGGALLLPAGAEVLVPIDREPWIALRRYPLEDDRPCFVDPAAPPLALYAVTPADTYVAERGTWPAPVLAPAGLDLPNDGGLPPGAEVSVRALGGLLAAEAGLVEAEWREVAVATVTEEGARIRTAVGEGVAYLTWIGLFPR